MSMEPLRLSIATRVYTELCAPPPAWPPPPPLCLPRAFGQRCLIFDTETRDEPAQRLLFGSYQLRDEGEIVPNGIGLIIGGSCTKRQRHTLSSFANDYGLELMTRDAFAALYLAEVWEIGTTDITFNAPFDHAKIACEWAKGSGRHKRAFTFRISRDTYKPRLRIEALDSRKQFMALTSSVKKQARNGWHKGYFVDVHTLVSALTDESHTLESACALYKTPTRKHAAVRHGVINRKYIKYNLEDVQATYEVYMAALRDFEGLGL